MLTISKLNNHKLSPKSLFAYLNAGSIISEQFRTIRTNILFSADHQKNLSIFITSPNRGEGKSVTSANLAISLAQQGKKVLLIDADLRKPSLHTMFKLNNVNGLSNVLNSSIILEEAIQKTPIGRLDLLTSGPSPYNPAELIGSHMLPSLLSAVSNDYNIVLFDTPPVLDYTDTRIIANVCDSMILVVCSGKTTSEKALEAKKALTDLKANFMGLILNKR